MFVSLRRVEPYIKWLCKVKVKVWPQVKLGQSHVMTEMGHIAYHSIRLAKANVLTPIPRLYLFLIKRYWQMTVGDLGWPQMTFGGVGKAIFLLELSTTVLYDMIPLKNPCTKVNITELIFCPLSYNGDWGGRKNDLTWGHRFQKSEIYVL